MELRWFTTRRAAVGAMLLLALAVGVMGAAVAAHASRRAGPNTAVAHSAERAMCPVRARELPAEALAGAVHAAVAASVRLYPGPAQRRVRAVQATIATRDRDRGGYARRLCGSAVQRRTVDVYLEFPDAAPSASLAQGVVAVSKTSRGFRVWAVIH